ncbi:hypothetical protein TNCV_3162401 [Trichonephila clavipes]|nr:hypothetical protein TNCV_3162401 [Trichonephila clavipes]
MGLWGAPLSPLHFGWGTPPSIPLYSQEAGFDSALSGVECACAVDGAGSRAKAYVHQFTSTVRIVPQTIWGGGSPDS